MKRLLVFSLIIAMMLIASIAWSDIIHVPGDYPTIQAGLDAAQAGDTVQVAAGTYTGTIRLMLKSGVDLIGAGADVTFLYFDDGVGANGATNLTLQGFTIDPASTTGNAISCTNGTSLTIRDNIIEAAAGGNGIECNGCGAVIIEENTVRNFHNNGIRIGNTPAIIQHNVIYSNGENGVECLNGANVSISNNEIYQNGRSGVGVLVDAGTVDIGGGNLGSSGTNEVYDNALYAVYNHTSTTIKAENNWWGESPPDPSLFSGDVDYTPWLTIPPADTESLEIIYPADGDEYYVEDLVDVIAEVRDRLGTPMPDVEVTFEARGGIVDPVIAITDENGQVATQLTVAEGENVVTAIITEYPEILDTVTVIGVVPVSFINGIVTDTESNPIEDAMVIIINAITQDKALTNADGYYESVDLPVGIYWIICLKKGYKVGIKKAEILAGETTTVDFQLAPR